MPEEERREERVVCKLGQCVNGLFCFVDREVWTEDQAVTDCEGQPYKYWHGEFRLG